MFEISKAFRFGGGGLGAYPLTSGATPDYRYRLAIRALAMCSCIFTALWPWHNIRYVMLWYVMSYAGSHSNSLQDLNSFPLRHVEWLARSINPLVFCLCFLGSRCASYKAPFPSPRLSRTPTRCVRIESVYRKALSRGYVADNDLLTPPFGWRVVADLYNLVMRKIAKFPTAQ